MTAKIDEKAVLELAWAAGFFDGEGNIRCRKDGCLVAQIAQVDRRVLDRFQAAVGGGNINGPYVTDNPKRQPYYNYNIGNDKTILVFSLLRPFLSPVKCLQGDEAISCYLRGKNVCSHLAA